MSDIILQRAAAFPNWDIAGVRQLNGTSDMNRYHIMRNRGYMMRYFPPARRYNRFLFGLGTAATFAKEVIRLIAVDRQVQDRHKAALFRGMRDAPQDTSRQDLEAHAPLKS